MTTRYIIIGGGIAGTTAAEQLRKEDPESEITILSEEQHPLYSRVLLPHYLLEKISREKVFMKSEAWYAEKNIEWMRGVLATKIDHANRFVETSEGRELPFDKLLITTGGEVSLLKEDRRGVSYLKTLDDTDHLFTLLSELKALPKKDRYAAVYGGGFIALEYINLFHHFKIPYAVLMRSDGFWSRMLSPASQKVLANHLSSKIGRASCRERV